MALFGGQAGLSGVRPGHRGEYQRPDQGRPASGIPPGAVRAAQCEGHDLNGLGRVAGGGRRLEIAMTMNVVSAKAGSAVSLLMCSLFEGAVA